jgi:hypothetical protein
MAVTALLVYQRRNTLRYRLTQDGQAGTTLTITTTGAVSPDLLTDTLAGKLREIARAFTNGYGAFAAGALTQAQARALWLSDRITANPGSIETIMTARAVLTHRTGATAPGWIIDANVDGGGHPTLNITAQAGAGVAYLDIELEGGAIGA